MDQRFYSLDQKEIAFPSCCRDKKDRLRVEKLKDNTGFLQERPACGGACSHGLLLDWELEGRKGEEGRELRSFPFGSGVS